MLRIVAEKIEEHLQKHCNESWHTKVKGYTILVYFATELRFKVTYNINYEDWYISGKDINITILQEVSTVIQRYMERGI